MKSHPETPTTNKPSSSTKPILSGKPTVAKPTVVNTTTQPNRSAAPRKIPEQKRTDSPNVNSTSQSNRDTNKSHKPKGNDKDEKDSSATRATKIVEQFDLSFFHTPEGEAFTSFKTRDHWENYALEDPSFKMWFLSKYYENGFGILSERDFLAVRDVFVGKALFKGKERHVHVRLAEDNGAIYLDLGDDSWEAVKITGTGWEIIAPSNVKFRRVKGMKSLPRPVCGGIIEDLRPFVNVKTEDDWKMMNGWLIGAFNPTGPYSILGLEGGQGSAKSTTAEVFRRLIDPNMAPLRSAPRKEQDLMISAVNGWCVALENLSSVPAWLSDALCRLSTGGGFSTRKLYTDANEKIIEATRPIILNGIDIGIRNGDLFDRTLMVTLPPIADESRRTETDFWRDFEAAQPAILGALLDAVVCALKRGPTLKLPRLPRMADFAVWVTAAEPALGWPQGSFLEAYNRNRHASSELALENSTLATPIELLMTQQLSWEGTATELLAVLKGQAEFDSTRKRGWPETPAALSGMLRRLSPNLKSIGISVDFTKTPGKNSRKIIVMTQSQWVDGKSRQVTVLDGESEGDSILNVWEQRANP